MLATPRPLPVNGEPWVLEFKWDGHRCQARRRPDGRVRLDSRNGRDQTDVFPEITAALAELCAGRRLSLDGEVVALGVHGAPEFERLQRRVGVNPSPTLVSQVPFTFVAFHVLDADGPTVDLTYRARHEALEELNLAHRHLVVPGYQTGIASASLLQVAKRYC